MVGRHQTINLMIRLIQTILYSKPVEPVQGSVRSFCSAEGEHAASLRIPEVMSSLHLVFICLCLCFCLYSMKAILYWRPQT